MVTHEQKIHYISFYQWIILLHNFVWYCLQAVSFGKFGMKKGNRDIHQQDRWAKKALAKKRLKHSQKRNERKIFQNFGGKQYKRSRKWRRMERKVKGNGEGRKNQRRSDNLTVFKRQQFLYQFLWSQRKPGILPSGWNLLQVFLSSKETKWQRWIKDHFHRTKAENLYHYIVQSELKWNYNAYLYIAW